MNCYTSQKRDTVSGIEWCYIWCEGICEFLGKIGSLLITWKGWESSTCYKQSVIVDLYLLIFLFIFWSRLDPSICRIVMLYRHSVKLAINYKRSPVENSHWAYSFGRVAHKGSCLSEYKSNCGQNQRCLSFSAKLHITTSRQSRDSSALTALIKPIISWFKSGAITLSNPISTP